MELQAHVLHGLLSEFVVLVCHDIHFDVKTKRRTLYLRSKDQKITIEIEVTEREFDALYSKRIQDLPHDVRHAVEQQAPTYRPSPEPRKVEPVTVQPITVQPVVMSRPEPRSEPTSSFTPPSEPAATTRTRLSNRDVRGQQLWSRFEELTPKPHLHKKTLSPEQQQEVQQWEKTREIARSYILEGNHGLMANWIRHLETT